MLHLPVVVEPPLYFFNAIFKSVNSYRGNICYSP